MATTPELQRASRKVRADLTRSTTLSKDRMDRVMQAVEKVLPLASNLASGILVVAIKNEGRGPLGVSQCDGGHICDTLDSTPGDGPDCGQEACDTNSCKGGHECENQSCGTEVCDDQHSCTGNFENVIDVSGMSASRRSAWEALQAQIDSLRIKGELQVKTMVIR